MKRKAKAFIVVLELILIAFCMQNGVVMAQGIKLTKTVTFDSLFSIKANEPVIVGNELQLIFFGHLQMITASLDYSSLQINIKYKNAGDIKAVLKTEYFATKNLPYLWRWKSYLFLVTEYEYNKSMTIKVCRDNYTE